MRARPAASTANESANFRRQVADIHRLGRRHDIEPMADISELTDIAGPAKPSQQVDRSVREPLRVCSQAARTGCQEMTRQQGHVFGPLTQRGKPQANDIEAMEQILAKQAWRTRASSA